MGKIETFPTIGMMDEEFRKQIEARHNAFEEGGAVERLVKNAVSEFHSRHKGKDDLKYYDAKGTTLLRTEDCQFCKAIAELEALLTKKEA